MTTSNAPDGLTKANSPPPDVATTPTQPAGGAAAGAAAGFSAATPVTNMADLKEKAPTLYKAMLEGIATSMTNEMKRHQDKIKELNRKAQEDAQGG